MKASKQHYKTIFLTFLIVFGVITLYAIKQTETPRFVLFLGRFHPLLLHLPIGALIVTFFIDIMGRYQKNYSVHTVRNLLGFTAFFAIITCFLGYFLSLEGGYQKQTLDRHLYTGILTAVLTSILFTISLKPTYNTHKSFLPLFITTLIGISVTGHFGSVLTHGDAFLTEYASLPKKEKTIEVIDSLRLYENVVAKIFDNKCISCHNNNKQKGELSLLTKESILKGGITGPSLVEGNAKSSLLYTSLLRPISDEKHMPPEGKTQLTKDEIWLIKHWINKGARFEDYAPDVNTNDSLAQKLEKYLVFNKLEIPKASKSDIKNVKEAGFRVLEIVPGEAELNAKYVGKTPTKELINQLKVINKQIIELDFHSTIITDEMTTVLKKLDNLKYLRLNSDLITDKALENFKELEHLEVLNIYNTSISNDGLTNLLATIQPQKIYAWNTQVDKATARRLADNYNIDIQNSILEGFVEESRLEMPYMSHEKTLFRDTLHINLKSRLKNVDLRYTLDGEDPDSTSTIFSNTIILNESKTLKVRAFKNNWLPSEVLTKDYAKVVHDITSFSMKKEPNENYPDTNKLFDLKEGSLTFSDGNWIGYFGNDLEVTIDLGNIKTINNISIRCLEDIGSWILYPTNFVVYTSKTKNGIFKRIAGIEIDSKNRIGSDPETKKITLNITNTEARYIKVHIKNHQKLPKWHPSAGNPSWLFVDEIYFW